MYENSARLLSIYDEFGAVLSQIKLYRGGGLSESHELGLFLQLFNGQHWRRDTGEYTSEVECVCTFLHSHYIRTT